MGEAEAFTELYLVAGIVVGTAETGLLVKNKWEIDEHKMQTGSQGSASLNNLSDC